MRRTLTATVLLGGIALAVFLGWRLNPARSGDNPAAKTPPVSLPIAKVVLFSSGVGYFQREGEVQGNARVDLSFPVRDINDLLKSMVLQDLGGGHVAAVNYDSQAPVEKTLRSFAINLTRNPSFGQILDQARGEKVEAVLLQTQNAQPANLTGVILGVEKKQEPAGKEVGETEFLNLWCAEGMRSVKMSEVQRVRFLNPVMDSEVKNALEVLAQSHDTQKKAVRLHFTGDGKRSVKIGYVVENPIWKTSYRLILDNKGKPFLQGWAIVENTQDQDWNNVRMALVSGRPISFQMDLYQSLFVNRPLVEPELFASLRPQTYSGNLAARQREQMPAPKKEEEKKADEAFGFSAGRDQGSPEARLALAEQMYKSLLRLRSTAAMSAKEVEYARLNLERARLDVARARLQYRASDALGGAPDVQEQIQEQLATKSIASAAVGTDLGDFFQYLIEQPVSLPRQKSAMLPIVNQNVEGTKVSIYNESTHPKFPLLGLKFKNSTPLHLMQGPITVFDSGSYAGDARIMDLQPKEERLISYAIDLGMEVEPLADPAKDEIVKIKIVKGVLEASHKVRERKTYNVKNRSEQDRVLLIEHPYRQDFKLLEPKQAAERARDVYRFEVKVPARKTDKLEIVEEKQERNEFAIGEFDEEQVRFYLKERVISEKAKEALRQAMALKTKVAATKSEIAQGEQRLKEIGEDQNRLRENLKALPPTSEAYKRYVKKFDDQETEIEKLQEQVKKLQAREVRQQKEFEDYLGKLNVE